MKTKFLLACDTLPSNPWERDRLPSIRKAFQGWDHTIIDIYDFYSLEQAYETHKKNDYDFFDNHSIIELNDIFYNKVISSGCTILILGTIDNYIKFLLPETVDKIKKAGIFVVGILGDDEFNYVENQYFVPLFDRVIGYVQSCVDHYNSLVPGACYYLPNSCYIEEKDFNSYQIDETEKRNDVVIFGAPFGIRPHLIRTLVSHNISVSIYGSKKWEKYPDLIKYYKGYIQSEKFDEEVKYSKIVLALLEDHLTGNMHMNTKVWEAVRNAQFCISSDYSPLIDDYKLVQDESIVTYTDANDLLQKVTFYLNNPEKRIQVAKNLFNAVVNNFNYDDLYKKIFENLEQESRDRITGSEPADPKLVTIIDISGQENTYDGFETINIDPGQKNWKKELCKHFSSLVKTPYVIITNGGYTYSNTLNRMVKAFPDDIRQGRAALMESSMTKVQKKFRKADLSSIVWKKDYCVRYLSGKSGKLVHIVDNFPGSYLKLITDQKGNKSKKRGRFIVVSDSLFKVILRRLGFNPK